jgi:hypothetical protein
MEEAHNVVGCAAQGPEEAVGYFIAEGNDGDGDRVCCRGVADEEGVVVDFPC